MHNPSKQLSISVNW